MMKSSVALVNASASTHLVTYSMATKMYVFWFDDGLIGHTKSSTQRLNGSITSYGFRGISSHYLGHLVL